MTKSVERTNHWSTTKERGSYLGIAFLVLVYRIFGHYLLKVLIVPVIAYFFLTGRDARAASKQFLTNVYQQGDRQSIFNKPPGYWLVFKHFLQFGHAAIDKIDALLGNIRPTDVAVENAELFQDLVSKDQGAVLIGSHLGNIDLCRFIGQRKHQKRINVLVYTQHAQLFNKVLKKVDPSADVDVIQVTSVGPDVAIMLKERVDAGEFVVIVGDRTSTTSVGRVRYAPFLGELAPFSEGPFVLAALMDCPVLLLFCLKEQSSYKVTFEPFAQTLKCKRGERAEFLQKVVMNYAARLEHYSLACPYQWYNFYNFWLPDHISQIKND